MRQLKLGKPEQTEFIVVFSLCRNQTGEEPLVSEAAAEIQNYVFNYRDQLLAGIIVAGWDKQKGGQVYQVPLGGMCIRRSYAIGGSGSSYVHGFIREFFRDGMSRNEAVEFVKKGKSRLLKNIFKKSKIFGMRTNFPFSHFSCYARNVFRWKFRWCLSYRCDY